MNSAMDTAARTVEALRADDEQALVRLQRVADQALALARQAGADEAELGASRETGLSVSVRERALEQLEFTRESGFGITVYFGHRKGSASSSDCGEAAIARTVEAACEIARRTSEDSASGLAAADAMASDPVELGLYTPWPLEPEVATDLALACEAAALAFDERLRISEGASLSSARNVRLYANSHGFVGGHLGSRHSLGCAMVAVSDDEKQRDGYYDLARDPARLGAADAIGRIAAERAVARLGARAVATGHAPVLFHREIATGLVAQLLAAISGGNLYRRASFLLDAIGEAVLPARYSLAERPHLPGGLGSAWFDNDGVATRPNRFVEHGVLSSYALSEYSARRLGLKTTGNAGGVHNLHLDDDGDDFDALLRRLDRGLLVTELLGQGVNLVTGDYSRGAAGFWVENGAIAHPVQEITIAGNLRDMLANIVAVGTDREWRSNVSTGSILIESMQIGGH